MEVLMTSIHNYGILKITISELQTHDQKPMSE